MLLSAFHLYVFQYSYTCYPYHSLSFSSFICFLCFFHSLSVQVLTVSLLPADQIAIQIFPPSMPFSVQFQCLCIVFWDLCVSLVLVVIKNLMVYPYMIKRLIGMLK